MEKILRLQRLGRNYWGNIAYEDKESGKIYFDIEDGHSDNPQLYTSYPSDDIDGEPNFPITTKYEIVNPVTKEEKLQEKFRHEYMMLSRLKEDCIGYLTDGDWRYHQVSRIWANDEREHIDEMRRLWNMLPVKPEWLTMEQINEYAARMISTSHTPSPFYTAEI